MASAPPLPPGFELEAAPPAPRGAPQPIIARTPAPRYSDEAARSQNQAAASAFDAPRAAAEARKANVEAATAEDARARHGLTAEQFNSLQSQYNSLGLLERGINEVDQLYRENYQGRRSTIGGYIPNIINPTARNFEAASNRLMSAIASAQGLSAQQQNTPTELRIRFGPMVPEATDDDATIEGKLTALRALLDNQRRTLSQQLGYREHPGDVEHDNAAGVVAGTPLGGAGSHPVAPGTPPPPGGLTVTDPRESGLAAGVAQQADQEVAGSAEPGTMYAGPLSNRFNQEWQSAVNGGASREQLNALLRRQSDELTQAYQTLQRFYPGIDLGQHAPTSVSDDMWRTIEEGRRTGRMPNFTPGALDPQPGSGMGRLLGDTGTAFVSNALDSASGGIPALLSEDFRNRLGNIRQNHPGASLAGAIVGGFFTPGGPRPGMQIGEQMARSGGQGAVYAFNESGGDPDAAVTGGTLGALAPPAFRIAGAGARGAYGRLAGRGGAEALPGAVVAQELNIPLMPGDVGGAFTRRATSVAAQLPFSTGRITRAYEATNTAAQAARDRIASNVGEVLDTEAAGHTATQGALAYRSGSRAQVGRAYDRAQDLAGDTRITPTNARQAVEAHIAELDESPSGAPSHLLSLRDKLNRREDFTVAGLRNERTRLRDEFAEAGLRGSDTERRAMAVVDGLTDDIEAGLTQAGRRDAAIAYRAADTLHRERIDTIDNVIMPIIGRRGEKSGEQVVQAVQRAARGNSQQLERFINSLPAEEASNVRATLIGQLGRATNGNQNAAGDAFSLQTFLTNYNAMTPSARRTVFGREGMRALSQLAEVADLRRQAGAFANRSNTGSVIGATATGGSLTGGIPAFVTAAATQYGMARLLTSPKLVRFLANMPREPGRVRQYIGRLDTMARVETNPILAQQFSGFADALRRAANDNAPALGSAAASPDEGPDHE